MRQDGGHSHLDPFQYYPVLSCDPNPVTPIQADIQTPVQTATLTITGGQLEVENPNRDATQFLQETQSATMTDIIHRISDLEQKHRLEVAENPLVSSSQNLTPEH